MRSVPAFLAAQLLLSFLTLGAAPAAAQLQDIASAMPAPHDLADRIQGLLATGGNGNFSIIDFNLDALRSFYAARQYQPVWTGSVAAQANASLALAALEHADDDGLQPDRYHLGEIDLRHRAETAETAAEYDILLTDSLLRYARDLRQGQPALREIDGDVGLQPDPFDPASALDQALRANRFGDFLANLAPPYPEYQHLKVALAHYRADGASQAHIETIIANMERWRWVPRSFGPRSIRVNVADATLELIDGGKVVLTSPVVAGKPNARTPLFSAEANAITFNPSWHVPTKIIRKEILPKLRANPHYLAHKHMVWREGGGIRQLPGPGNALGTIKFEMPNDFDAYLHDTPLHKLFAEDDRHLSHGCVRVEQIRPLASYAMTGDVNDGLDRIQSLIKTRTTRTILLDEPLPVYVLYWTAIADADGAVNFLPDVYGRDQRLISALADQHLSSRVTMNFGATSRN